MSEPCDHEWIMEIQSRGYAEKRCRLCGSAGEPAEITDQMRARGDDGRLWRLRPHSKENRMSEAKTFTREELEALGTQIAELQEATDDLWRASEIGTVGGVEECERLSTLQSDLRLSIASTLGVSHLGFKTNPPPLPPGMPREFEPGDE